MDDSQTTGDESQVLVPDSQVSINESHPFDDSQAPLDESQRPLDNIQRPYDESQKPLDESQRPFNDNQWSQSQPLANSAYLETQSELIGAQPRDDSQYSWPFPSTQVPGGESQDPTSGTHPSQAPDNDSQRLAESQPSANSHLKLTANEYQSSAIDSQPSTGTQSSTTILANIHATERALRDIAKSFRFTYEEVKEYYDRCHDLARVRMRFQEMREVLRARFGD